MSNFQIPDLVLISLTLLQYMNNARSKTGNRGNTEGTREKHQRKP